MDISKQLYWNHTLTWMFSCKFAAFFQNTFSQEHLWMTASGYCKKFMSDIKSDHSNWHARTNYNFVIYFKVKLVFFLSCISAHKMKLLEVSRRYSIKKCVHKNFAKFTGKHLCHSLEPATLFKNRLWHKCLPVNFAKFLRISILKNNKSKQLLQHFS